MQEFLQLVVSGVSLGSIYALLALGFVTVFRATGAINFAHPGLLLLGTYVAARLRIASDVPFWIAVLVGVAATAVFAVALDRFVLRKVAGQSLIAIPILTIGVDIMMQTELSSRIGSDVLPLGDPWADGIVNVAGLSVPTARLAALGASIILLVAFLAWFRWSRWGIGMRAAAENPHTAALMGIRLNRVSATAWGLAGALAVVAGVFLTTFPAPGLEASTSAVALRAFPAAVLGGLDSTTGAVVGGVVIGLAEVLSQGYADQLTFLGGGFHTVMPYVVMLLVLLVRPAGLFGTKEMARV